VGGVPLDRRRSRRRRRGASGRGEAEAAGEASALAACAALRCLVGGGEGVVAMASPWPVTRVDGEIWAAEMMLRHTRKDLLAVTGEWAQRLHE